MTAVLKSRLQCAAKANVGRELDRIFPVSLAVVSIHWLGWNRGQASSRCG